MNKEFRKRISEKLKEKTMKSGKKSGVRLPSGFIFSENPEMLTLRFSSESGMGLGRTYCNMQNDNAAFEGWALAIYVHYLDCKGKVCLDLPAEDKVQPHSEDLYTKFPHYSQFLYRVLRFSEQYPWFVMSAELKKRVDALRKFLEENHFTNNVPSDDARKQGKLESIVENCFAEDSVLKEKLKADKIYRQLPVGLFRGETANANRIFTGKSSAIDLWAVSGDVLTVMELKVGGNKKIGAVTELFFYANYVYDMFVKKDNCFHPNPKGGDRGYTELRSASLKKVCAYLLLDKKSHHPLITDTVLKELSWKDITYDYMMYQMEVDVKVTMQATREEMKQEAILRMQMLGMDRQIIQLFKDEGTVSLSQPISEQISLSPVDDEFERRIQCIEKAYGYLVYHVLQCEIPMVGCCRSLLFVSSVSSDWEEEQRCLKSYGYVISYSYVEEMEEGTGEVGEIVVESRDGGLFRTA